MNKIKKKKNKKRKCKHELEFGDPCFNCGYEEGECKKCGVYVYGNEADGYEEW